MRTTRELGLALTLCVAAIAGAQDAAVVREAFDSVPAGWQLDEEAERGAAVRDGALVVWIDNSARRYQLMTGRVPGDHRAVTVEVEVRKVSGAPATGIGLVCFDGDAGRYCADVDEEGEVRLGASLSGEGQKMLAKVEKPGVWREGANHMRLECGGGKLAFSVNGERLLTAADARLAAGSVGLRAGGAGSGRTEAIFDNLVVTPR